MKKKIIGVIGPGADICSQELYLFGLELGNAIAELNHVIVCGGLGGMMEAVCKGIKLSKSTFFGQTIGIIPSDTKDNANMYCDIVIPTGLGINRNIIIVNSAEILIAAGGGAGTLSEIAFAWQKNKTVICYTGFAGWSDELGGRDLDNQKSGLLIRSSSINDIINKILSHLSKLEGNY